MTPAREALARLVEARLGIKLGPPRPHDTLDRWVRERTEALVLHEATRFVEQLAREAPDGPEWKELVRRVTNGQTYFLRDAEQLEIAVDVLAKMRVDGPREIWAPACSTGEEAYSLVMLCIERGVSVNVLATDVNDERLEIARTGVYDERAIARIPARLRARFVDASRGVHRIASSVRDRVRFGHQNLLDAVTPRARENERWDLILCRNVFIYFGQPQIERIARSFAAALGDDGFLIIGPSETLRTLDVPLESVVVGNRTLYQRQRRVSEKATPEAGLERASVAPRKSAPAVQDWLTWLERGHVHLRAHAFEQAGVCYEAAARAGELVAETHFFTGVLACKRADNEAAVTALRRALFLEPRCWPARLLLVPAYERIGDAKAAARELLALEEAIASTEGRYEFRSDTTGIASAEVEPASAREVVAMRKRLLAM